MNAFESIELRLSEISNAQNKVNFRRKEILDACGELAGVRPADIYRYMEKLTRVSRGIYTIATVTPITEKKPMAVEVQTITNDSVHIPKKDEYYVSWGFAKDVETIIKSGTFFPVYISGLSGNGKTFMIEQACARANRQYIRVQITPATDEDDLIGGFRLVDGETVFSEGPVVKAMKAGAVLLLDEIDRASDKIMCLQGVLEGKPILNKKTGEVIAPAPGFEVIATANTKGRGSEDGRYISANIIDDAFLERFTVTHEQPYPTEAIERKIVLKHMDKFNCVDEQFAQILSTWSDGIRKTFNDGGIDDLISTRRLCHIVQTYSIFRDRKRAIELCVNRFEEDVRDAFVDLYEKMDASLTEPTQTEEMVDRESTIDDILNEI